MESLPSRHRLAGVLKLGLSETQAGVTARREAARRVLGDGKRPWYWTYRVRLGIR